MCILFCNKCPSVVRLLHLSAKINLWWRFWSNKKFDHIGHDQRKACGGKIQQKLPATVIEAEVEKKHNRNDNKKTPLSFIDLFKFRKAWVHKNSHYPLFALLTQRTSMAILTKWVFYELFLRGSIESFLDWLAMPKIKTPVRLWLKVGQKKKETV